MGKEKGEREMASANGPRLLIKHKYFGCVFNWEPDF